MALPYSNSTVTFFFFILAEGRGFFSPACPPDTTTSPPASSATSAIIAAVVGGIVGVIIIVIIVVFVIYYQFFRRVDPREETSRESAFDFSNKTAITTGSTGKESEVKLKDVSGTNSSALSEKEKNSEDEVKESTLSKDVSTTL